MIFSSLQFLGSEQCRRDVSIFDLKGRKPLGIKQIWDWNVMRVD
jgi:hypothetical protein